MFKNFFLLLALLFFSKIYAFDISQISHYDFDTFDCSQFDEEELIRHCESTKSFIKGCYINPNSCDCSYFSEDEAKAECQKWVDEGIKLMSQKSEECMNDLTACSCADLPHPRLVDVCENEKAKFIGKLKALEQLCFDTPEACDCSIFEKSEYVSKCNEELAKGAEIKAACESNISLCDCSIITNLVAKQKCEEAKTYYVDYESNFRQKCEDNFDECDCTKIPNLNGQKQCEEAKKQAVTQAEGQVYAMLYDCFKDINSCDCTKLENTGYINYCEETKSYGFACMQTGGMGCEQLDNIVFYPPGLPTFLQPYFAQTFKSFIDAEKLKGMAASAEIAKTCVIDPENCDCSAIPVYAREFCLDKKEMQLNCINGNITACELLDQTINVVPLTAPKFVRDFLDPILRPLVLLQKEQIKGQYAEKVKDQMLACIDDENSCNCESVPLQYQEFCSNKINLVKECRLKNYESCFRLMDESNIPDDIPGFIRIFVESSVNSQVNQRMNEVFLEIRPSACISMSVSECRKYYEDNCKGLSVNECLVTQ
ncbi:MAG: hypothetical protein WC376_00525 [Candidatus Nanoarchaeia archaeon]|jgi:hypothetical protein